MIGLLALGVATVEMARPEATRAMTLMRYILV